MRFWTFSLIGALVTGTAGAAWAAEGKEGLVQKSKRESASSQSGGGMQNADSSDDQETVIREDRRLLSTDKRWEVELDVEGHHIWRQTDMEGSAQDRNVMYYSLSGRYQLTPFDQVQLATGFYQRFLADGGETGIRGDDILVNYAHLFELPDAYRLTLSGRLTAPTSFYSQKESIITVPSVGVRLSRMFFGDLVASLRTRGTYVWARYVTAEGGQPNTRFSLSFSADVEYVLPVWRALSFGAEFYTAYHWYYDVGNNGTGSTFWGALQTPSQPVQQNYGGDIFARYRLPEWQGLKPEIQIALADGDPTLGYDNRLHDGAAHLYLAYRRTAETYAVFSVAF